MPSKSTLDPFALELPEPTPEDLAALERADRHDLTPEEYLQLLQAVTKGLPARAPENGSPEPFEL